MNRLYLRLWVIASITLALSAAMVRLVWEATQTMPTGSLVIIILLIITVLGIYILLLYITIKPSLKKLKSLPVAISATIILTGAITGCIIHYIRFVPSPEASSIRSVAIASLLLAAGVSIYFMVLWVIWSFRRIRKG
jgi:hypothetical protein